MPDILYGNPVSGLIGKRGIWCEVDCLFFYLCFIYWLIVLTIFRYLWSSGSSFLIDHSNSCARLGSVKRNAGMGTSVILCDVKNLM